MLSTSGRCLHDDCDPVFHPITAALGAEVERQLRLDLMVTGSFRVQAAGHLWRCGLRIGDLLTSQLASRGSQPFAGCQAYLERRFRLDLHAFDRLDVNR